jgi:MFS family permease
MKPFRRFAKLEVMTGPFRSLRHVNYRWYWISGLGMAGAQGMKELALAWLVLDLTGSLAQLGIVVFMQGLPQSAVALFGGVLADRYDRRWLLFYSQVMTGILLALLAWLTLADAIKIWHVYTASVLLGITQAITLPARQALIRNLVERDDVMNALALNNIQMHASRIVWPSVAGALIALVGIGGALVVNGVVATLGAIALIKVRYVRGIGEKVRGSPLRELADGLSYAWTTPQVAGIVAMAWAVGLFGLSYMRMAPGFAREELGMDAGEAGIFLMCFGIGAVIASVLFMAIDVKRKNRLFILINFAIGLAVIIFALNPWYYGSYVLIMLLGMGPPSHSLMANTIFQLTVPSRFLGRITSLWGVAGGFISMSGLLIGVLGEAFGLRWALGGSAVVLIITISGLLIFWPPARNLWNADHEMELSQ